MINDSSPERRNLMVLSISIMLFYYAGGHVTSNVVSLPMISVEFSRPEVLVGAIWVALFWFIYRYWQTTDSFENTLLDGMVRFGNESSLFDYFISDLTKSTPIRYYNGGGNVSGGDIKYYSVEKYSLNYDMQSFYVVLNYFIADSDGSGKLIQVGSEKHTIEFNFKKRIILILMNLYIMFVMPKALNVIVPYILGFTAIMNLIDMSL